MASSTGNMEKEGVRGAGVSISVRQRRRKRLIDKNRNAGRPSPPTISEHKSMDHSRHGKDKLSLSADATAETTILSAETSETTPDRTPDSDSSVRVRKVPFTPTENSLPALESVLLPQSILTTTQTFPPPERQIPKLLTVPLKLKNSSHVRATSELLPPPPILPRRPRSQSVWDETRRKERTQQKPIKNTSPAPVLSQTFDGPERLLKPRAKVLASRPKPKLERFSTAPLPTMTKQTNVVDDVLMDRAFIIRQNLMNFEMEELAAEAEKAADSGLEKFVGSTSKFGVEETPPYKPKFVDDGEFVDNGGLLMTPSRRKTFVDTLTYPMDYTPSYFSRKKIPVTSLRKFSEIVPNFSDMHNNVRLHLSREGVDVNTLPELHSRQSLIKNDTDDTEKEDGEDAISQAPSIAASHTESISSFSSYAVASLASLKEIIELVNRPRSPADNTTIRTASSISNASYNIPAPQDIELSSSLRSTSPDTWDIAADRKKDINTLQPRISTHFKPVVPSLNSDSDDSSVEFYGRKSPIDLNQSASSNVSEKMGMNQWKSSLSRSRSNQSYCDRKRRVRGVNVSFETEKASYQALLDKMHHHTSPSVSFDVDQTSCAPSLTNLDIDILSISPTTSTSKSPMANFLSKIGFSRSASTDGHQRSKVTDEDNQHFVSNFFYTNEASNIVDPNGVSTLRLDINPERDRDPYCMSGCGPNNLLSACDTATKYVDLVFDWFNVGGDQPNKSNAIIDTKATEQALHPNWMKTWQTYESLNHNNGQRFFTPPKLSVKHAVTHEDDIFCSPDSAKLGSECEDTMTCPVVRQPMCPEIHNKIGCSPE